MTQAIIQTNLDELLADCGTIDAVSWQAPKQMTYAQWAEIGEKFQYVSGSMNWWLGDWLAEGEKRYGETYTQAVELTGHKQDHLMKCKQIAEAVQKRTRVQFLSWTHHRYVSHLPDNEQRLWLEHAQEHNLSSRELKQALEQANAQRKPLPQPDLNWMPEGPRILPIPEVYTNINGTNGHSTADNTYEQLADDLAGDESGYDWTSEDDEYGPIVFGELGHYRQKGDTKRCEKCRSLWVADLDYCPYCHLSTEVRAHEAKRNEKRYLSAANHAISDTPGYDGDEWYTPIEYIEAARRVMGDIDLDPASCAEAQAKVNALEFYTKQDDSLQDNFPWFGRIWLNPPYSMPLIKQFVTKLIEQYEAGNVEQAVIITNNSSDTGWFHELLARYPACFTRGRVQFWRPNHEDFGTRQGQTLFYLGDNEALFVAEFSKFGKVVKAL